MVIFQYNLYIFLDPSLNLVISKTVFNELCYKEVEVYILLSKKGFINWYIVLIQS